MPVHGEPQPDGLHEDSPLADASTLTYVATKARAGQAPAPFTSHGLEVAVLRPGAICAVVKSRQGDLQTTWRKCPMTLS